MNRHAPPHIIATLVILSAAALGVAVWLITIGKGVTVLGQSVDPAPISIMPAPVVVVPTSSSFPATGIGGGSSAPAIAYEVMPTPTIPPWPTMQPTPTPSPMDTYLPLEPPQRAAVNGIPWESIIVMPPDVIARAREIYRAGQMLGRNPNVYSKVGDSTTENPHFLARFDDGPYNLGAYAYLQPVIDHFRRSHGRDSIAVRIGLHAWTANDPSWAEPGLCEPNETPVACEIRVHNPAVILIRLGTNDVGVGSMFDANIRRIVDTATAAGVIPVIGTKGDRHEGSNENNDILRRIATDYHIPLWDYDRVADTLPGRGLDIDDAHMLTFYAHDYTDPTAFTRGHAMHNLTALMALDAVWREVMGSGG